MAGRGRRGSSAAWAGQQRQHVEQVRAYRFVAGWGVRRSATVVPEPLRYWQYEAPGAVPSALAVGWLALFGWSDGWSGVRDELPWAVGAGVLVLALNVRRTTVSDHGLTTHTAGTHPDASDVVALAQVREVHLGRPPADWPAATPAARWWPFRSRVAVRYATEDGGERAASSWVRDAGAFADAVD